MVRTTYGKGENMLKIDKNSKVPLYYQLMQYFIKAIEDHHFEIDEKLPSERECCDKYQLSRSTVRQAFLGLEQEGYIYKVHGKGMFVSPKKINQELLKFYSFTSEMKKIGKTPSSKLLRFEVIGCDMTIAHKLGLAVGEQVYRFQRLRLADNEPVMAEVSYVPQARFAGLTREMLEHNAMYDVFSHTYDVDFTFAEERFQAVATDSETARLLNVTRSMPSLKIERFTYEHDRIIEYTVSMARGDQMVYSVKLGK